MTCDRRKLLTNLFGVTHTRDENNISVVELRNQTHKTRTAAAFNIVAFSSVKLVKPWRQTRMVSTTSLDRWRRTGNAHYPTQSCGQMESSCAICDVTVAATGLRAAGGRRCAGHRRPPPTTKNFRVPQPTACGPSRRLLHAAQVVRKWSRRRRPKTAPCCGWRARSARTTGGTVAVRSLMSHRPRVKVPPWLAAAAGEPHLDTTYVSLSIETLVPVFVCHPNEGKKKPQVLLTYLLTVYCNVPCWNYSPSKLLFYNTALCQIDVRRSVLVMKTRGEIVGSWRRSLVCCLFDIVYQVHAILRHRSSLMHPTFVWISNNGKYLAAVVESALVSQR